MMTTVPNLYSKKPKVIKKPLKSANSVNKKPILKLNKPAPMLGKSYKGKKV